MADYQEDIEKQYYSIGEVAQMLDVNTSLIRFWETEFDILQPKKNRKGNRIYRQKDLELLKNIYYLVKVRKFTLEGAREKLRQNSGDIESEKVTRETLLKVKEFLSELKSAL